MNSSWSAWHGNLSGESVREAMLSSLVDLQNWYVDRQAMDLETVLARR